MKSLVLLVIVALSLIPSCLPCPSGWIQWHANCYKYYSDEKHNFQAAEDSCREIVPHKETCPCQTAHLASIESDEENAFLLTQWKRLRTAGGIQRLHIGYTDRSVEGRWRWVDGSSSGYKNWDKISNEPNNRTEEADCGIMWNMHNDDGTWNDANCSKENPYFCKFRLI